MLFTTFSSKGDVNDAMGSKKKTVVVTSDPLALIAEKTNVSRSKEKVVVSSNFEGSKADDFRDVNDAMGSKKKTVVVTSDPLALIAEKTNEKYAKLEAERYEYMIRYFAYFDNDKQHRKQIVGQQVLYDKMSVQLVELDKHVRDVKNTVLEKDFKIFELEECVRNKDLEIEIFLEHLNVCENKLHKMDQTNQTIHMIMPSKDNLYNCRNGISFKNPSYFEIAKDLRPTLYDEKVIGLGYTLMFLIHSDEALEIEKFKRSRENKIEFAYDYGDLNASYVNEKINFEYNYFQEIINPDFEKIDSPFQQTSSLKPYVPNVILEKIIIDLEDEVVKNQSENDCLVVEKECDKKENSNVIAPRIFKLNVSQCVSLISMSKSSCESNNVEIKLKRKRHLDTFNSVRRPKNSGVIWKKKKGLFNTSNVSLSVDITYLALDNFVTRASKSPFESLHALIETNMV
nr:hypothetical protein [Tanacetum cinerariifolium]